MFTMERSIGGGQQMRLAISLLLTSFARSNLDPALTAAAKLDCTSACSATLGPAGRAESLKHCHGGRSALWAPCELDATD